MAKLFYFRHQGAGVMSQFPFSSEPTPEQRDAIREICKRAFGETHKKTGQKLWLTVVEATVYGPSDIPEIPEEPTDRVSSSATSGIVAPTAHGVGTVVNPRSK